MAASPSPSVSQGSRTANAVRLPRFLLDAARRVGFAALGVGILLLLWAFAASLTEPIRIPSPTVVWDSIRANFFETRALAFVSFGSGGIIDNLGYTVLNVVIGVAIGAVIGVITGVSIARVRILREALELPLLFLGTVPVLVLLPFLSFWFGTSRIATNGLVIFYSFVMVSIVADQATRNVGGYFEDHARSLGASSGRIVRSVIAPAIVPEVIGALRVVFAFGWGFQAIAEVLGGQVGIGRMIRVFAQSSATADMIGLIVCLAIAAVIIDGIIAAIGNWVTRWKE